MPPLTPSANNLLRREVLARTRDFEAIGIERPTLAKWVVQGDVQKVARGAYALPGYEPNEHTTIMIIAKRSPDAIICLLSALRFHNLTTQAPFQVWVAVATRARPPRMDYPQIRVVRFSERLLDEGVETRLLDGVPIRITSPSRTVVDCFKFRNKIGLEVAIEALRDVRKTKKSNADELWHFAKLARVSNVMRPYLESVA